MKCPERWSATLPFICLSPVTTMPNNTSVTLFPTSLLYNLHTAFFIMCERTGLIACKTFCKNIQEEKLCQLFDSDSFASWNYWFIKIIIPARGVTGKLELGMVAVAQVAKTWLTAHVHLTSSLLNSACFCYRLVHRRSLWQHCEALEHFVLSGCLPQQTQ